MKSVIKVGDRVQINSRGHRQDGRIGTVVYRRATYGVSFDGDVYGFLPQELVFLYSPEPTS